MRLFSWVLAGILGISSAAYCANEKKPAVGRNGNDDVDLTGTVYADKDVVSQMLGIDPGRDLVIVEIKVSPRTDKALAISPDDFTLLSHKDGQRSSAFSPSQLAGKDALVLQTGRSATAGMYGDQNGPTWSGPFGTHRIGKDPAGKTQLEGAKKDGDDPKAATDGKENPLMAILKTKGLPEKESLEPVTGYLYFPIDGKVKGKELSIIYKGPAGRIVMEFQDPDSVKKKK